jgi:hypothetical protein
LITVLVLIRDIDLTYDAIYMVMEKDMYEIAQDKKDAKLLKWGEELVVN